MQDQINVKGQVKLTITRDDGTVTVIEQNNMVMREGRTILKKLLSGNDGDYSNAHINRISFGTSNATAVDTQTNLVGTVVTPAAAITVSNPAYNTVMFSSTLGMSEGNSGSPTYQEIGLFSHDNRMFSRVVIAPQVKDSTFQIAVDWTIIF